MMNPQQNALTELESEFAQKHHDLVMNFLKRKRLPQNEFYDAVIFRYLRTVQLYCRNPELRKYSFASIANKAMNWAMKDYWRRWYKHADKSISLDTFMSEDGLNLSEMLPASIPNACDAACDALAAEALLSALDETGCRVLQLRLDGYSPREIAREMGLAWEELMSVFSSIRAAASLACLG